MEEGKKGKSETGGAITKANILPRNGKQGSCGRTEEPRALLGIMPDRRERKLGTSMGHRGPVDKTRLLLRQCCQGKEIL